MWKRWQKECITVKIDLLFCNNSSNRKNTMSSTHHNGLLLEPPLPPHSPISSVHYKTTQIICSTLYYSPNIPHCSIYNCPECFSMVITICTNTTPASFSSPITPTSSTLLFPPLLPLNISHLSYPPSFTCRN